ncbi:hypothetical protein PHYBLDRAFT_62886 [Phycomyces blakesleeanus NRRL 1555(-)]|uniref:ATP-dependent DNA helicase n=1 Tax=Phycomyces blakesleeanus (strain ATCC 8743b / DSM 1359 / FGSC 10004 / NBRC 33097 / NRRL 1555) TaxID=763407 RepID=A0A167NZ70_PHYB8|nr:hypothetical protein PHYBLDRAFT_62886 [Phycomyces blakesleeanus NRRL 1555(-)]OAD76929.1 hypothetical protein PHYBLDRAFT_62886 [Phycomyces blakesleeanus NRRL 1555(-)]|eukprot:XP_018294969.1 hypothetical protein PHYBLDRAFT_62886 [Phycomyces blakesleeanus NRRL 1555(-)]
MIFAVAESSRAAASRPRVEAAWDFVVPTQLLSIDLSFTEQYTAESDRYLTAAFEALQVSDVERVLDLTTTTVTATATVISHCSSCNGIGHQWINYHSQHGPAYYRLCNGTRLICNGSGRYVIKATIVTGSSAGKLVLIPRIKLNPTGSTMSIEFKQCLFPVRLAFAMTINKFQGQILDKVGLYLPDHVFGHGQLYVTLSGPNSKLSKNHG